MAVSVSNSLGNVVLNDVDSSYSTAVVSAREGSNVMNSSDGEILAVRLDSEYSVGRLISVG